MIDTIGPREAAERLRGENPPLLIDVREDWERDIASIPGSQHLPMGQVPARLGELPRDRAIILHCHHGARSLQVGRWLRAQGYDRLANLDGGIDEWSRQLDPEIPRYT